MKSIFNETDRNEIIRRIETLDEASPAQWGKMNVYQMIKHCSGWEAWMQGIGDHTYKQVFIGKIFGKMALNRMLKDDKPLDKGVPTATQFKIKENAGDIPAEKQKWVELIQSWEHYSNPGFIHDFFGKMTEEQVGMMVYKHNDHHLRQFNS